MKRRSFTAKVGSLAAQVAAEAEISPAQAVEHIGRGAVYVRGRRVTDAKATLVEGAPVLVILEEAGQAQPVQDVAPPLRILFESADVLAVDKPAGVVAQPTPGGTALALTALVRAHLGREGGLVHRLDKETSGVTVFGKHAEATTRLAAAFREGTVRKTYLAIVPAAFTGEGEIDLPLSKDPARPGRWRATRAANGVPAATSYRVVATGAVSVVELRPQTGRTHQLRAHLTALGAPIVGDRLYGGAPGPRCLLHAWRLELDGLKVEAPLPADFLAFPEVAGLGGPRAVGA